MSKQPRPLVAANWKMNGTRSSARTWAETMSGRTMSNALECDIVVSPPMPLFDAVYKALTKSGAISLCGQDCATQGNGPHTGDTSVEMLVEAGCRYVLVGHSERRGSHGESNSIVKAKATRALAHGLIPIICVGETLSEKVQFGNLFFLPSAQIAKFSPISQKSAISMEMFDVSSQSKRHLQKQNKTILTYLEIRSIDTCTIELMNYSFTRMTCVLQKGKVIKK